MPYQVRQIIEGNGPPVCVTKDETVSRALSLMVEHDFSQLPVVQKEDGRDYPQGTMITYESILRGIRNFSAKISDLKVRDVMVKAPVRDAEADLFDILDDLKNTNAVLLTYDDSDGLGSRPVDDRELVGIVTSYDTAEYFRDRTEDLMRVEDIDLIVKELIKAAYTKDGELDEGGLNAAIGRDTSRVSRGPGDVERQKTFDELSLADYIALLLAKDTWPFFEPILGMPIDSVRQLLNGVRETRNVLAHFRDVITAEQSDRLKFGSEWLTRCQESLQERMWRESVSRWKADPMGDDPPRTKPVALTEAPGQSTPITGAGPALAEYSVAESAPGGGRWAALADWLQSQSGGLDNIKLKFARIEEIIKSELPASALEHRAWWANDPEGHSQSQQWLEAGWRTTYINLSEGRVTFSRIREREKAYISFFSKMLDELQKTSRMPIREVSPDGVSWIVINTLPRRGGQDGAFNYAFSRDRRFRVELYLDLGDKGRTKAAFRLLFAQKNKIEAQSGPIEWELLDNRRASRLAQYHDGQITDEANHAELHTWGVETMVKFYNALVDPAERAITQAKQA